jgi:acyl-coenzyme A synthetase/AMP-(fatty) acid ligase
VGALSFFPSSIGLVHTQAGYLLFVSITHKYVFDYHDGDVYACVADDGWITGKIVKQKNGKNKQ